MDKSKRAKPTSEDLRAAERLKNLWRAIPRERRPTQEALAHRYGEGANQSLISQYLNGHIPLNLRAVLFFARELDCRPEEIYPDLPGLDGPTLLHFAAHGVAATEESDEPIVLDEAHHASDEKWRTFSAEQKQQILKLVELAGLIGITGTPKSPLSSDDHTRQSDKAIGLRQQRKAQRVGPARGKRRIVSND